MNWNDFLTERDQAVFEACGYGRSVGLGERPAVLVVDVTYNFCGEKAEPILDSIKKRGRSCGEEAWAAVARIRRVLDTAITHDIPIIYTTGIDYRLDGLDAGRWFDKFPAFRSEAATDLSRTDRSGNDIVAPVAPRSSDLVIRKPKPSAFFGTPLEAILTDLKVDTLIVCGTTTSGCIRATVVDGFSYNYRVVVVEDGTFDRIEASHHINLFDMQGKYADVLTADDLISLLKGQSSSSSAVAGVNHA